MNQAKIRKYKSYSLVIFILKLLFKINTRALYFKFCYRNHMEIFFYSCILAPSYISIFLVFLKESSALLYDNLIGEDIDIWTGRTGRCKSPRKSLCHTSLSRRSSLISAAMIKKRRWSSIVVIRRMNVQHRGWGIFFFLMTFHLPMSMNYNSEDMKSDKELLLSLKAPNNLENWFRYKHFIQGHQYSAFSLDRKILCTL